MSFPCRREGLSLGGPCAQWRFLDADKLLDGSPFGELPWTYWVRALSIVLHHEVPGPVGQLVLGGQYRVPPFVGAQSAPGQVPYLRQEHEEHPPLVQQDVPEERGRYVVSVCTRVVEAAPPVLSPSLLRSRL